MKLKQEFSLLVSTLLLFLGSSGCTTNDAGTGPTNTGGTGVVSGVELTPMVKSAIIANPSLNDSRNQINVESKDNVVHLTGHVYSPEMKDLAGSIAQRVLIDNKSTNALSNELTISTY